MNAAAGFPAASPSPAAGTAWPILRPATRAERRLSVIASTMTGTVTGMIAVVVGRDHLIIAGFAVALIVVSAGIAVALGWRRRVEAPETPRFWNLEPTRRRALRSALVRGRLGPPTDRAYARYWLGRRLRYPTNSAVLIGLAGWNLATSAQYWPDSTLLIVEHGALALLGGTQLLVRRRWMRLAEIADSEAV